MERDNRNIVTTKDPILLYNELISEQNKLYASDSV